MKKTLAALGAIAVLSYGLVLAGGQQKAGLKVFISVDMEGISGVVHGDQTTQGTAEYASGRKWMAQDVNAAVEGALCGDLKIVFQRWYLELRRGFNLFLYAYIVL